MIPLFIRITKAYRDQEPPVLDHVWRDQSEGEMQNIRSHKTGVFISFNYAEHPAPRHA